MPTIEQLAELKEADRAAIVAPLDEFSRQRGFVWQPRPMVLVVRNELRDGGEKLSAALGIHA